MEVAGSSVFQRTMVWPRLVVAATAEMMGGTRAARAVATRILPAAAAENRTWMRSLCEIWRMPSDAGGPVAAAIEPVKVPLEPEARRETTSPKDSVVLLTVTLVEGRPASTASNRVICMRPGAE